VLKHLFVGIIHTKEWQIDKRTCNLSLSVNVSQKQFQQSDFIEKIKGIIAEHGVEANKLKIELTESVLAKDLELTVIRMNELGKMGIKLSLDDFGTGYSSLQYLKTLPLYQLKIDYSFVRDLSIDSNDRAIVKTIISMAKGLGLGVIAEGVETIEQKNICLVKAACFIKVSFLAILCLLINLRCY
jgi:EAL domain-containing protein (putative c-di-GMP-specific phosphodiesterase class I)